MCICNKKTWKLHVGHLHCMQFWSRWTNTAILDHTRTIHNAQWGIYHTDKLRATTDAHFQHTIMRMLTLLGICILDQSSRIKWQKKHSQCGDFILPHWHEVCLKFQPYRIKTCRSNTSLFPAVQFVFFTESKPKASSPSHHHQLPTHLSVQRGVKRRHPLRQKPVDAPHQESFLH
jgi:hypothetical protein